MATEDGSLIILDCGTGARELGRKLTSESRSPLRGHVFLSHTHWDHIQGIPFFAPFYQPGNSFTVYAARGLGKRLQELLAGQMEDSYFPVRLDQLVAQIEYREVGEEPIRVGDAVIQARYLNHTTLCLGYRVTADGATLVYATDHEPYTRLRLGPGDEVLHHGDAALIEFARGADLLIHDGQYDDEEFESKVGWGHSTHRYAAAIAAAAGVKRLALYHYDPEHSDAFVDRQVHETRDVLAAAQADLAAFGASEGLEVELTGDASSDPEVVPTSQRRERGDRPPRVLIADDDRLIAMMVQDALRDQGYELLLARDGQEALDLALAHLPDLLILDGLMPRATGFEVCAQLRQTRQMSQTPIILLTSLDDRQNTASGFREGASDYLTKPFTRSVLQSRIRSWLVRSGAL